MFTCFNIPEIDAGMTASSSTAFSCEGVAIGTKRDVYAPPRISCAYLDDVVTCFNIPEVDAGITASSCDGLTIWAEDDVLDRRKRHISGECSDVFTGFYIPEIDDVVPATSYKDVTIRTECQIVGHIIHTFCKSSDVCAGFNIIEIDVKSTKNCESLTIWTEDKSTLLRSWE